CHHSQPERPRLPEREYRRQCHHLHGEWSDDAVRGHQLRWHGALHHQRRQRCRHLRTDQRRHNRGLDRGRGQLPARLQVVDGRQQQPVDRSQRRDPGRRFIGRHRRLAGEGRHRHSDLVGHQHYTGATTVNAGTLIVNGSIASSPVTVNAGATLAGTGSVGATTIMSGGTFAPGNSPGTMTVQGSLAFQSGAIYLVQVTPSLASSANVTAGGSATLAGTVQAAFATGSYVTRNYTILSAAGGLGGTTFNA